MLQAAHVDTRAGRAPRFGFTATRKTGNAVERNRIRRRLREVVRLMKDNPAADGYDYVIVARREALNAPFERLAQDLRRALSAVSGHPISPSEGRRPRRPQRTPPSARERDQAVSK